MKLFAKYPLWIIVLMLIGCKTQYNTSYLYFRSHEPHIPISVDDKLQLTKPRTWFYYTSSYFDDSRRDNPGTYLEIKGYEWSPIVHFNYVTNGVRWQDDKVRMEKKIEETYEMRSFKSEEELSSYNKFIGHGVRKIGMDGGYNYRLEYILFYPESELSGVRIIVIFYNHPNAASVQEVEGILQSVKYVPNQ